MKQVAESRFGKFTNKRPPLSPPWSAALVAALVCSLRLFAYRRRPVKFRNSSRDVRTHTCFRSECILLIACNSLYTRVKIVSLEYDKL